jgi:hypothetical protein
MANDNKIKGVSENLPTFGSKRFKQTIKSHKEVLEKFFAGFQEASKLEGNYKIFLDTNVILRIYSTSFKARQKLLQFFKDYKDQIVLTAQIQWEYVKNRENVINTFSNEVTKTIPENFSSTIINSINSFKDKNKSKLIDYPNVENKLAKLQQDAEKLLETIESAINDKNISLNEILYNDDFIKEFENFELLAPLDEDYLKGIKIEFDSFIGQLEKSDFEKEAFKAFPGCYEKKEKSDDPYGDYIIYHEILNYSLKKNIDVIFITEDVTKGDWMQKNKSPHLHYVENFYLNTNRMIYILDGQRTFEDLLDINFKSLVKVNDKWAPPFTEDGLFTFLDNYPPFAKFELIRYPRLFKEVIHNGYTSIEGIEMDLSRGVKNLGIIKTYYPNFNKVGMFRVCMTISNPVYEIFNEEDGYHVPDYEIPKYLL